MTDPCEDIRAGSRAAEPATSPTNPKKKHTTEIDALLDSRISLSVCENSSPVKLPPTRFESV
jgi:hypothetical protein